jgi:hypothetical protein
MYLLGIATHGIHRVGQIPATGSIVTVRLGWNRIVGDDRNSFPNFETRLGK